MRWLVIVGLLLGCEADDDGGFGSGFGDDDGATGGDDDAPCSAGELSDLVWRGVRQEVVGDCFGGGYDFETADGELIGSCQGSVRTTSVAGDDTVLCGGLSNQRLIAPNGDVVQIEGPDDPEVGPLVTARGGSQSFALVCGEASPDEDGNPAYHLLELDTDGDLSAVGTTARIADSTDSYLGALVDPRDIAVDADGVVYRSLEGLDTRARALRYASNSVEEVFTVDETSISHPGTALLLITRR